MGDGLGVRPKRTAALLLAQPTAHSVRLGAEDPGHVCLRFTAVCADRHAKAGTVLAYVG
jgi:hypothetical protein